MVIELVLRKLIQLSIVQPPVHTKLIDSSSKMIKHDTSRDSIIFCRYHVKTNSP